MSNIYVGSIHLKYCSVCGSLLVDSNSHQHYKNGVQSYCTYCRKIYDDVIRHQVKVFKNKRYDSIVESYRKFIFEHFKNKDIIKIEDVIQNCKNKCSLYFRNNKYILTVDKDTITNFLESDNEYFIIEVMSPIKGDYTIIGNFVYSRKEVESFPIYHNSFINKYVADFNAEIKFDDNLRNTYRKEEIR